MLNCLSLLLLVAGEEPKVDTTQMFWLYGPPLVAILFLFMILDSPKKREKAKRELLKNLKKDDRVVTIGGILGSVANISQDGKEVTLKVDDGTRIRFRRTAIDDVLTGEPMADSSKTT